MTSKHEKKEFIFSTFSLTIPLISAFVWWFESCKSSEMRWKWEIKSAALWRGKEPEKWINDAVYWLFITISWGFRPFCFLLLMSHHHELALRRLIASCGKEEAAAATGLYHICAMKWNLISLAIQYGILVESLLPRNLRTRFGEKIEIQDTCEVCVIRGRMERTT